MGRNHKYLIERKINSILDASKGLGLEVTQKTMYLSGYHVTRPNHFLQVGDQAFENVAKFIYLGPTVTNQRFFYEKC
jgi:hypothetical protein